MDNDPIDPLVALRATLDQLQASLRQITEVVGAYRSDLVARGFSEHVAERMAAELHTHLLRAAFPTAA